MVRERSGRRKSVLYGQISNAENQISNGAIYDSKEGFIIRLDIKLEQIQIGLQTTVNSGVWFSLEIPPTPTMLWLAMTAVNVGKTALFCATS